MNVFGREFVIEIKVGQQWERTRDIYDNYEWALFTYQKYQKQNPNRKYRLTWRPIGQWEVLKGGDN